MYPPSTSTPVAPAGPDANGSSVAASAPGGPGGSLPPGEGRFPLPHYLTFSQITNAISRTYRWSFDEALRHDQNNALAIRRDPVVMDALRSRQIPTAQLPWHIEAENDQDTQEAEAAQECQRFIETIPRFQTFKMHLLEGIFFGKYGVQTTMGWDFSGGKKRLKVTDHKPVHGDKLSIKYDGRVGVLVHGAYKGDYGLTDRGRAHFLTPNERRVFVIHRHEPEDADFFEPELGGGIAGVGIRSRIYWFWWLRSQVQAWLMDYLERVGAGGFTIYFYEAGNQSSLSEVKSAAEEQHRNNTILFPRYRDGSTGGPGIQRMEPSQAGSQLLQALISNYFDEVIRRYILGQNLTSETAGTGMGSGVADLHQDTFARLVKYDAINLAETLTADLVNPWYDVMYPGVTKGKFTFDVDKPNARDVLESATAFWQMGGTIDEDELRSIIGLARPQPGHAILAKMGSMQPAALGGVPQGVPVMGEAGLPGAGAGGMPPGGDPGMMPMSRRKTRKTLRRYAKESLNTDPRLLDMARAYTSKHGLQDPSSTEYHPVYEPLSRRIADYYQQAPHAPRDPAVKAAYDAMTADTRRQFDWAQQHGIKFEPWTKPGQPYRDSGEMRDDVKGGHLFYYLGTPDHTEDNLLMRPSGVEISGHQHTHNDLFRAVHDLFGHAVHGNQFGPRGEEHAWRTHAKMYSPEAAPAVGMETRGQNSWVNFGQHLRRRDGSLPSRGDTDWIHPARRPFAPQKNNRLPPELMV